MFPHGLPLDLAIGRIGLCFIFIWWLWLKTPLGFWSLFESIEVLEKTSSSDELSHVLVLRDVFICITLFKVLWLEAEVVEFISWSFCESFVFFEQACFLRASLYLNDFLHEEHVKGWLGAEVALFDVSSVSQLLLFKTWLPENLSNSAFIVMKHCRMCTPKSEPRT